jgi:hypothetical protein
MLGRKFAKSCKPFSPGADQCSELFQLKHTILLHHHLSLDILNVTEDRSDGEDTPIALKADNPIALEADNTVFGGKSPAITSWSHFLA